MAEETYTVLSAEASDAAIKLMFDDGAALVIDESFLPPEFPEVFLCSGARIDGEQRAALEHAALCRKAEKAALALIARAEQCRRGLKIKLEKKKLRSGAVEAVLDRLCDLGLVNDQRYAELWLKARIGKGNKGPRALFQLLAARGIDRETANTALAAALPPDAEAALLCRCLEKEESQQKKSLWGARDPKTARRHFLKAQGFSADCINGYFEELE
jgi:regulatory protein